MVLSRNEWCSKQNLEVKMKSNIKQNKFNCHQVSLQIEIVT